MATVYLPDGTPQEVPDDQVTSGIRAGRWGLDPEGSYRVLWGDGAEQHLPGQQAADAISQGHAVLAAGRTAALLDAEAEAARRATPAHAAEGAIAAALGVADSASVGQTGREERRIRELTQRRRERDAALAELQAGQGRLFQQTPEEAAREERGFALPGEIRERQPGAYVAGQIGGVALQTMLGGALAPAGALPAEGLAAGTLRGLAGRAARAAGGPEATAGLAVQRYLQNRLGVSALTSRLAGGVTTTGALMGARGMVTDAEVQGTPFSAEQLAAYVGGGALFGLGGELIAAGAGALGRRVASRLSQTLRSTDPPPINLVEDPVTGRAVLPQDPANPLWRAVSRAQEVFARLQPGDVAPFTHKAVRQLAVVADREVFDIARAVNGNLQDLHDATGRILATAEGAERQALIRRMTAGVDAGYATREVAAAVGAVGAELGASTRAVAQPHVAQARNAVQKYMEWLSPAQGPKSAAEIFVETNRLNDRLAAIARSVPEVERAAAGEISDRQGVVHRLLEREDLWGPAATAQREINRAVGEMVSSRAAVEGQLASHGEHSAGRVMAWFDNLARPQGDQTWEAVQRWLATSEEAAAALERHGLAGAELAAVRARSQILRTSLAETEPRVTARAQLRRLMAAESRGFQAAIGVSGRTIGVAGAGALGAFLGQDSDVGPVAGGALGLAAGAGFVALSRPASFYQQMAQLDHVTRGVRVRWQGAMGRLRARVMGGAAPVVEAAASSRSPLVRALAQGRYEDRVENYRKIAQEVDDLRGQLTAVADRVANRTARLHPEVDPTLQPELASQAQRTLTFLATLLPPLPQGHWPDLGWAGYRPSETEIARLREGLQGTEDPVSVAEDLAARGRTSFVAARALEHVYPRMFSALGQQVFEMLTDPKARPSYRTRLELGSVLNVPTDRSLDAGFIDVLQARYAQTASQARAQGMTGPRVRATRRLSGAQTSLTVSQQVEAPAGF